MLEAKTIKHSEHPPPLNAPILIECQALKNAVCSAAEAECGGLFNNGQTTVSLRQALEALGHPQLQIPLKTDNKTANSFAHATMRVKRSKTWDIRDH